MEAPSRVTLKLIAGGAAVLFRLRVVFVVIAIAAGIWFGWAIANPATQSAKALIPLTVMLWAGLALGIGYMLPSAPQAILPGDGFWLRTKKRCVLFGYALAVLAALVLGGFALVLSLRALSLSLV